MPSRLLAVLLLLVGAVQADPAAAGPSAGAEKARIEALMRRALEAGRAELEKMTDRKAEIDPDDRSDAEKQFARLLRRVEGCDSVLAEIRPTALVMGQGIDLLIRDSIADGDRRCAALLAPLMLERSEDPIYTRAGHIRLRFQAGALLDASGKPEGRAIMREAEAQLRAAGATESLWDGRKNAIVYYSDGPGFKPYLEYLAERMGAEPQKPFEPTRNGLFTLFARHGRCDLVRKAAAPFPGDCKQATQWAEAQDNVSPEAVEGLKQLASAFGYEELPVDEKGLAAAIEGPVRWGRMTKLLMFVIRCEEALGTRPAARGSR
ncbi:MAG TPA: hypothetical protein VF688_02155 [Allosphingosinicella sp.]